MHLVDTIPSEEEHCGCDASAVFFSANFLNTRSHHFNRKVRNLFSVINTGTWIEHCPAEQCSLFCRTGHQLMTVSSVFCKQGMDSSLTMKLDLARSALQHADANEDANMHASPVRQHYPAKNTMRRYDRHLHEALMALHVSPQVSAIPSRVSTAIPSEANTPQRTGRQSEAAEATSKLSSPLQLTPGDQGWHSTLDATNSSLSRMGRRDEVLQLTQEQRMLLSTALRSALSVTDALLHALHDMDTLPSTLQEHLVPGRGTNQGLEMMQLSTSQGGAVLVRSRASAQELRRLLTSAARMLCRYSNMQTDKDIQSTEHSFLSSKMRESHVGVPVRENRHLEKGARFEHLWSAIDDLDMTYRIAFRFFCSFVARAFATRPFHAVQLTAPLGERLEAVQEMFQAVQRRRLKSSLVQWNNTVQMQMEIKRACNKAVLVALSKMFGELVHNKLGKTFIVWREYAYNHFAAVRGCARVLARWKHQTLSRAYQAWLSRVETNKYLRRKAKTHMIRLLKYHIRRTLITWVQHVQDQRMTTQRVLGHWTHRTISAAFDRWLGYTEEHRSHRQKVNKVLQHWLQRTLAQAWETWVGNAHALAHSRKLMTKISMRWLLQGLSIAFYTWADNATQGKRARMITQRVLGHWTHRTISESRERWLELIREKKMISVKAMKVVRRFMKLSLCAAWVCWREHVQEHRHLLFVFARIRARWTKCTLIQGFFMWMETMTRHSELQV